ncbi:recombinase family protein [Polaromonas sp. YR568]|uniref:recombinase family protein n=1 Tax=Polaromonas sp. YR568 TaxID=1855301 RepID=UPI00398BDA26
MEEASACFHSLTEPVDTSTGTGRMMMHMLGAFAKFERGIIRERSIAGQQAARCAL